MGLHRSLALTCPGDSVQIALQISCWMSTEGLSPLSPNTDPLLRSTGRQRMCKSHSLNRRAGDRDCSPHCRVSECAALITSTTKPLLDF